MEKTCDNFNAPHFQTVYAPREWKPLCWIYALKSQRCFRNTVSQKNFLVLGHRSDWTLMGIQCWLQKWHYGWCILKSVRTTSLEGLGKLTKDHSTCLRFLGPLRNPHMQLIFLAWPTLSSQDFMMLGAAFGGQGVCLGLGGVSQEFCKQSIYKS